MLDHPVAQNLATVHRKVPATPWPSAVVATVHLGIVCKEFIVDGVRGLQVPAEDVYVIQEARVLGPAHEAEWAIDIVDVP